MRDLAGPDQLRNRREWGQQNFSLLGRIELGIALQGAVVCDEHMTAIALNGGIGVCDPEGLDPEGVVAGFFAHFASGALASRGVFGIQHAAGNLQGEILDAVPELADQYHFACGCQGNDIDPIPAFEDEKVMLLARSRRAAGIFSDLEDAIFRDGFGIESLPTSELAGSFVNTTHLTLHI